MDTLINQYFPSESQLDEVIGSYSSELKFASNMVEQGSDAYNYLLSIAPDQYTLERLVVLLGSTYGNTEFHENLEVTIANRFPFTAVDFIDE